MGASESWTSENDNAEVAAEPTTEMSEGAPDAAAEYYRMRSADPVVRWLAAAIAGVVVVWLAGVVSAFMFGMVTPPKAPRTATERDLSLLREEVQSGSADTRTWARYIDVLVTAGQLPKAREAIGVAMQNAKSDKSFILAEEARLYYVAKTYPQAIASADKAMTMADAEYQTLAASYSAKQITATAQLPESWGLAALTKAQATAASGDNAGAIKAYDVYLEKNRIDADILVRRGELKAAVGDASGAAEDYREALRYVPDYKPAVDGLGKIGAGAK